jgi:hypothetical protein
MSKQLSNQESVTKGVVVYLIDTIEALTDQICQRVPSIPVAIRIFCKALFDTITQGSSSNISHVGAYRHIASFIIE